MRISECFNEVVSFRNRGQHLNGHGDATRARRVLVGIMRSSRSDGKSYFASDITTSRSLKSRVTKSIHRLRLCRSKVKIGLKFCIEVCGLRSSPNISRCSGHLADRAIHSRSSSSYTSNFFVGKTTRMNDQRSGVENAICLQALHTRASCIGGGNPPRPNKSQDHVFTTKINISDRTSTGRLFICSHAGPV